MTHKKNKSIFTLLLASSIVLLLTSCANTQNSPTSGNTKSQKNTAETISSTNKVQPTNDNLPQQSPAASKTKTVESQTTISSETAEHPQTATATKESKVIATKPITKKDSNYPTLTDDQIAMTAEELLNDPDLIRPLIKNEATNYSETDTLEINDDEEEYSAPEEINFDDDFNVPEFAQKLLDESYPDYSPPTGKLFGFMRRHLLKRGDSPKPWTVEDDFNGDNKPDWAALMVNNEKQLDVIVIYSEDEKYRLEVLYEGAGIDNNSIKIALSQEKPGDKIGASYKNKPGKFRTATLEFPGINIMYYTKSSSLFYWHQYYFDELLTSN